MQYFLKTAFVFLFAFALSFQFNAQKPGIQLSYIDSSANPRDDFYNFCNGKWQKSFTLPESDARYGSFNEIDENNLKRIKEILDNASKNKAALPNTDAQRLRDFYNTAMDSAKADALRFDPIKTQLEQIDKVKNLDEFLALKSDFDNLGINLLFEIYVSPNLKNSKKNILTISQSGPGLGDRDYYYEERFAEIRKEYDLHLLNLFSLIGTTRDTALNYINLLVEFERNIAYKSLTRVQRRDLEKTYNVYTLKKLATLAPEIKWAEYFKSKKIKQTDTLIVEGEEYLKEMSWLVGRISIQTLKAYAKAHLLMESAPYLSSRFVLASFRFRGQVLSGTQQMKPRWQRIQNVMNASIGDIVSQEFVKKYFPPESKTKVNKLIDNLILAYRERIASRTWMGEETKKQANKKLDLLIRKIGYPEKWKNYTGLTISTDNYWANICRVNRFLVQDNLNDLKKPVDRKKWQMTAVTVNAYYDPSTNEITFPAAILQPPFFDPLADDAANYGTIGSIIGHELTHGFDDQGSQFDANGNMKMWWTKEDYQNFKDKTVKMVEQFNSYVVIDTLRVNGKMTLGENIADLGGVTMAYSAYKKSLVNSKSKIIGGFTGEQRFFMAWAQGWKAKTRDTEMKRLLTLDYHSPAYFRAYAPLTNIKEFYEAFDIKPENKMFVPENKRVEIW